MKKLNLGCGEDIRENWVNLDTRYPDIVDVVHNLNEFPYPFEESSVDFVLMDNVLEHLDDVVKVMEEIHRILKPKGRVEIFVPHYKHRNAYTDPTHKQFFTVDSIDFFTDYGKHKRITDFSFNLLLKEHNGCFPFYWLKKHLDVTLHTGKKPSEIHWILEADKNNG